MEFDNVIVKENPGLCRCCLSEGCYKELGTEYPWMDETEVYADMLLECFDISISQHGEGPNGTNRLICEVCITRLRDACNFKKQVLDCEKKFVDMIGRGEFKQKEPPSLKCELNLEETNNDGTEMEYLDDGMDFDNDKDQTNDITVETLPMKSKRGRPRKNAPKPEKKTKEDKPRSSKNKDDKSQCGQKTSAQHLHTLFTCSSVIPFKNHDPCQCFFCGKVIPYNDLKKHTKSHGFDSILNKNEVVPNAVKVDVSETTCEDCDIVFNDFDALIDHLTEKHDFNIDSVNIKTVKLNKVVNVVKTDFNCSNCSKVFISKLGYKYHVAKCGIKPRSVMKFNNNTKIIKQNIASLLNMSTALPFKFFMNRFRCFYCSKDFVEFDLLKDHTVSEHTHCDLKSKAIKFLKGRDIHLKIDESSLSCKLCRKDYSNMATLIDHLNSIHNANYDTSVKYLQAFKIAKESIPCPLCPDVFQYFRKLLEHMNSSHSVDNFVCAYCGQTFGNNYNYRAHISRYHRKTAAKCIECGTEYSTQDKLARHRASAHGLKSYKCPECSERFGTPYLLQKHLISAHSSGHKCGYCGKMFTRNSHMRNHIRRTHFKEKNFECSICGEKFFDNPLLKTHMVKHIGERNYHCDVCGKRFLWKKNLRGHMTSHEHS